MRIFRMKAKTGEYVRLYSDDTDTLAFCGMKSQETTPEILADCLPLRSLLALWEREPGRKISRAIQIAVEY